ncbi:MAG: pyruvate carboxylase subunit B [Chloroflexi bacterium]|nr:pyruvate carboxylase subunit B [Chloroflexota bacterium]
MPANPIKITDTTFRDAHQSLMATRMRIADMEPIAAEMDSMGFHSLEVWGGATYDAATRFLAEDPWERLRTFKGLMPKTPLMMLLRGQSLVGYRAYANDVVDAFVQRSAEAGIDIFRVFDALNDERNLEKASQAVKANGKHLQLAICYSLTEEGRLGGPIYNLDYYVDKARRFQDMGADSICLKDMGGLMAPYDAYELVTTLKSIVSVPLQLHTHYTSGMASMTLLKAIEAGIDVVDTCLAPLALRTSQPAIEPLEVTLRGTDRACGLDLAKILRMGDYLESILPKYRQHMENPRAAVIDVKVLSHQIPGGMASNLISQLREADALDRLDEVLTEIPRTRKELGNPPLVTPMSQMIGSQAVSNVLFGRYKMMSDQVKDYAYGMYGRSPAPLDPQVKEMALKGYERGSEPFTGKPADLIEPEMEQAREAIKDISTDAEDVLTYALFPSTGLKFLRIKHGLDPIPDDMKPKSLEQVAQEAAKRTSQIKKKAVEAPPKSSRTRTFNVYVEGDFFEVEVDPVQPARGSTSGTASPSAPAPYRAPASATPTASAAPSSASGEATINAPMPGIVLRYIAEAGQSVQAGDPILVLEAMKMENTLPSPITGVVKALPFDIGVTVAKDDILAIIAP